MNYKARIDRLEQASAFRKRIDIIYVENLEAKEQAFERNQEQRGGKLDPKNVRFIALTIVHRPCQ